ncbi:MAG TPA: hypothetical protein VN228_00750 [Pyrinomonadaceae bacterium]|nr:hypothetical protein [Pyrinomonadaceae bacterium]
MNEEERQRQVDFIINQQARFAADIQRLGEAQGQMVEAQKRTDESLGKLVEVLNRLAEVTLVGFEEVRGNINALTAKLDALTAKQSETDDRLNKMILVVERHISEGHHGNPRSG